VDALAQGERCVSGPGPSQATQLLGFVEAEIDLFHTPEGETYACFPANGHRETWPIASTGFREWLAGRFFRETGAALRAQSLLDARAVLAAKAKFDKPEIEVHVRDAPGPGGEIYLDLGGADWQAVKITPSCWTVVEAGEAPVRFRRTRSTLPLPAPVRGGQLSELREHVNVTEEDWPLFSACLVASLVPDIPFPVLVLGGEQGTAKSTTAKRLVALVDPRRPALRGTVKNEHDLMIAAKNSWVLAFDNVSHIQPWLSDALCGLATGTGFGTRELWTNDEEALIEARRFVVLNGIENFVVRGDLADRAVTISLPRISEGRRRTEREIRARFEGARPRILGALLDAVVLVLRERAHVAVEAKPRCADFAEVAVAAEPALGALPGSFLAAYRANREAGSASVLEDDGFVIAAQDLVRVQERGRWLGRASDLLAALPAPKGQERTWPATPKKASNALRRAAPALRALGWTVVEPVPKGHEKHRVWSLVAPQERPSAATVRSTVRTNPAKDQKERGADGADGTAGATSHTTPPNDEVDLWR
jgi:hypothetical protein